MPLHQESLPGRSMITTALVLVLVTLLIVSLLTMSLLMNLLVRLYVRLKDLEEKCTAPNGQTQDFSGPVLCDHCLKAKSEASINKIDLTTGL